MLHLFKLWRRFVSLPFLSVLILTLVAVFGSAVIIHLLEPKTFPSVWNEGIWWVTTTMTTVGYGDLAPKTLPGRLFGMLLFVYGIGLMTLFIGRAFEEIAASKRKKEEGKVAFTKSNHYIFIGWGKKTEKAIEDIIVSDRHAEIVLIDHELEKCPTDKGHVHFIKGDAADEAVLVKANLLGCKCVSIFSDEKIYDDLSADGKTGLIALAVEGFATTHGKHVYTTVEIRKSAHQKQFKHAKVDAFVLSGDSVALLMAREAMFHGSASLFNQLLSQDHGADWFEVKPRPHWTTYQDAAFELWKLGANLIAVNDDLHVASQGGRALRPDDKLYIVCSEAVHKTITASG
ncbi:potassium channel family protein [Paenibacillus kobensis]|uniref:potassium channel family protein n=1 Tax=Paenibacillus kobensis TaxID=59841 RepID=UPI000FDABD27|nr:potassium channel family protein [Paenibacillus kobensis]